MLSVTSSSWSSSRIEYARSWASVKASLVKPSSSQLVNILANFAKKSMSRQWKTERQYARILRKFWHILGSKLWWASGAKIASAIDNRNSPAGLKQTRPRRLVVASSNGPVGVDSTSSISCCARICWKRKVSSGSILCHLWSPLTQISKPAGYDCSRALFFSQFRNLSNLMLVSGAVL